MFENQNHLRLLLLFDMVKTKFNTQASSQVAEQRLCGNGSNMLWEWRKNLDSCITLYVMHNIHFWFFIETKLIRSIHFNDFVSFVLFFFISLYLLFYKLNRKTIFKRNSYILVPFVKYIRRYNPKQSILFSIVYVCLWFFLC